MFKKLSIGVLSILAMFGFASASRAAADEALTNALASSSGIVTDNLTGIMGYIVTVWGKGFLIGLILAVLGLTAAIVIGAIFRRKKGKK